MAAAPVNSNNQAQPESPTEKPKQSHTSSPSVSSKQDGATVNGVDSIDSPYFKELQRNLRNTMKKLNAIAKVDAIIAESPEKSLDDLVAEKKINADQKAQALKKPALQASIVQIEEQITHYKEFAAQYEQRLVAQKVELEKAHKEELDALQDQVSSEANKASQTDFKQRLLGLSKFLCAAATMRRSGDETSSLTRAFEGVLYQVYGGSHEAVNSMLKLIDGVDEKIVSVEGETLEITYGEVRQSSEEHTLATEEVATDAAPASDPTLANAGYTELQDSAYGTRNPATNESTNDMSQHEQVAPPAQTLVGDAANAVAEANWNANARDSLASSANTDGWVEVPRDPTEIDTGVDATPVPADMGDSCVTAEEASGNGAENATVPKPQGGDGFEAVVHHQRQNSFRGGRGRGGRGRDGFRGRGRGDFKGRGRGRGGRIRGGPNSNPATPPAGSQ